jgi:hypothetical protein
LTNDQRSLIVPVLWQRCCRSLFDIVDQSLGRVRLPAPVRCAGHRGQPRPSPSFSAGHGVLRLKTRQCRGDPMCSPPGLEPSPSGRARLCGGAPTSRPTAPSAGHGVLRSKPMQCVEATPMGSPRAGTVAQRHGAHAGASRAVAPHRWAWGPSSDFGVGRPHAPTGIHHSLPRGVLTYSGQR